MKKVFVLILGFLLVFSLGACNEKNTGTKAGNEGSEIVVSNMDEFMRAIKDDVVIMLEPGRYDIEEWMNEIAISAMDYENEKNVQFYTDYYNIYDNAYIGEVYDGYEIAIIGVKNITIKAKEPDSLVEIVAAPRYAQVIHLIDCYGVKLENIKLGHSPDMGHCSGNVIEVESSDNIDIVGCDLYGCGVYGLDATDSKNISILDSVIHDCEYGAVDASRTASILIRNSVIRNMQYGVLSIEKSDVEFNQCSFEYIAENFGYQDESRVTFNQCTYDYDAAEAVRKFMWGNEESVEVVS